MTSRHLKAVAAAAATVLAALGGGTGGQPATAAPPLQCKMQSYTMGPGQSKYGTSCSWKYGCECVVKTCLRGGRWAVSGKGKACTNLPG